MKATLSTDFAGFKKGHTFNCNPYLYSKLQIQGVIELPESAKEEGTKSVVKAKKQKSK